MIFDIHFTSDFGSIAWCLIQLSVLEYSRLDRRTKSILQETCCVKKHHSHKSYIDTPEPWEKKSRLYIKITINILEKDTFRLKKITMNILRAHPMQPGLIFWCLDNAIDPDTHAIITQSRRYQQFHKAQYNFTNLSTNNDMSKQNMSAKLDQVNCAWLY